MPRKKKLTPEVCLRAALKKAIEQDAKELARLRASGKRTK